MKKELNNVFMGMNNADLERARGRLIRGNTYRDLSTIIVIPVRSAIPLKVVQSWLGLITPMNQKVFRMFIQDMEVGAAYSHAIEQILAHPELSNWKYILTLETDNCPPPDGLIRLYESMNDYDVVGGLYWVKSSLQSNIYSQPMIYGDPNVFPKNFIPQVPTPETVQHCNGLGMGFTLFKLDMFKKIKERPFFKTVQEYVPGQGTRVGTQDLQFFNTASGYGYKFACDTRVKVGHYDAVNDEMW